MFDPDPPIAADDTQPRPPLIMTVQRDEPLDDAPQRGCANSLLILVVAAMFMGLCVAIIGLAGAAGYRDGSNDAATHTVNTRIAAISTQLPHISQDIAAANWDSALLRCAYVGTLQPGNQAIAGCIAGAQAALSATPTPTSTVTALPPTATPSNAPTSATKTAGTAAATSDSANNGFSPTAAWARALEENRKNNFETAVGYLEAIRELAPNFNTKDVTSTLCSTYENLGNEYQAGARLSEMVIVINKALDLSCHLADSSWAFTINAAQLYLDAKSALDSGDYARADRVYRDLLMPIAPSYLDTKALACQAFNKAGDTAAQNKYCSP